MDHLEFTEQQTAATYVANGLDEAAQEAFESHMMGCDQCTAEVEVWRAIKTKMPFPRHAAGAMNRRPLAAFSDWRMAASLIGAGIVGATGGWLGRGATSADLNSTQTVVFNLPSVTRGAEECFALRLASDTRVAILRVPGVSPGLRIVALDSERRPLPMDQYGAREQPDGSGLIRLDTHMLVGRHIHLEARRADGSSEPLGCVVGEMPALEDAQ
jgi:hypothetical protein